LNLLELAERRKIALLQASTSEIYGDPTVSPQSEIYWGNCNPIGVRACYDEGKRAGETLCADYKRQYGTDTKVARIFNTYGPNMALDDGRVVSNFIFQALTGRDLTIYGDGNQIRSFCYVDDLIDGLIKLFFSSNVDGPVNLGNPEPLTMNLLAREVIELTNTKSAIVFLELPGDDPITREPDITKARNLLGFKPIVGRREGLKKTISNFQARIDA
jgi:UDP-glucuronate decarboxylase